MTLLELCQALRGLIELTAISQTIAVDILASQRGLTRFAASLLLINA